MQRLLTPEEEKALTPGEQSERRYQRSKALREGKLKGWWKEPTKEEEAAIVEKVAKETGLMDFESDVKKLVEDIKSIVDEDGNILTNRDKDGRLLFDWNDLERSVNSGFVPTLSDDEFNELEKIVGRLKEGKFEDLLYSDILAAGDLLLKFKRDVVVKPLTEELVRRQEAANDDDLIQRYKRLLDEPVPSAELAPVPYITPHYQQIKVKTPVANVQPTIHVHVAGTNTTMILSVVKSLNNRGYSDFIQVESFHLPQQQGITYYLTRLPESPDWVIYPGYQNTLLVHPNNAIHVQPFVPQPPVPITPVFDKPDPILRVVG